MNLRLAGLAVFALLVCAVPAAFAAEAAGTETIEASLQALSVDTDVIVTLDTGEHLSVTLVERGPQSVVVDHPVLGRLQVPIDRISAVVAAEAEASEPAEVVASADATKDATGWTGELSFGLDGSSGNSDRSSFRAGGKAAREMKRNRAEASAYWSRSEEDSVTTEHKAGADARYDWLFAESPWEAFAKADVEYDELKDFDLRVTGFGGTGYRFIDEDGERLIGRLGAGASRKIGGTDTDIDPELLIGADYKRRLSELQSIAASLEVFPSLGNFGEYRAVAKADWEVLLAAAAAVSLRLGVEDRYDSNAVAGDEKNDLDYYGALVKKF